MSTFRQADREARDLLEAVLAEHHPELATAEVKVGLLYAHAPRDPDSGEPTGPALKHHGYPAGAVVKINSLKDRVEGKPDATVTLDGDQWPGWDEEFRRGILDHELQHLEVQYEEDGMTVKLDDLDRPKLKMRPHDWELGGFDAITKRHQKKAPEIIALCDIQRRLVQRNLFPVE